MDRRGTEAQGARVEILVRPLRESDLAAAERIFRLAFGTFLGAPHPESFWADRDYHRARWRADPTAAFGAEVGGELVGTSFANNWGSVGFLGPLTVRPDRQSLGVGKRLIEAALTRFEAWGTPHIGLFTFAHSALHVGLYQKFGFWPRFLTAIMARPVTPAGTARWLRYSELAAARRGDCLGACRALTNAVHDGLDVTAEIRAVDAQQLGDTVLLEETGAPAGLAICHYGAGSEAGAGACYVKFGAVRPGRTAARDFAGLLDACEALAAAQGIPTLVAGVNLARHEAYRHLLQRGFRTELQGVAMHRPNEPGYNRPGIYLLDDWR